MFEYKFQTIGQPTPTLDNTSFGFVAVENAIQTGIANQYIISVPVTEQTLDGVSTETIQVRVYYGSNYNSQVIVSEWSSELDVYLPPVTPVIYTAVGFDGAYYDSSLNDLFVLLDVSANPYNYDNNIQFLVCFFYQDSSGNTVWKVSDPTSATSTTLGSDPFKLITVPLDGIVDEGSDVYVSIHAVYDWQSSYLGPSYHAVSYISNEVIAVPSSQDSDPDITDVSYNVYSTAYPGDQTMTITWTAPGRSVLPFFTVDYYQIFYSLTGSSGTYQQYGTDISGNVLEYTVDVGSTGLNLGCGNNITYIVKAIDVLGTTTQSAPSDTINIFKYSEAVTDLAVSDVVWDPSNNVADLVVTFQGVSDTGTPNKGCGTGQSYVVEINGSIYSGVGSLVYSSGSSYSISYTGLSIPQTGDVTVYLQTDNTNPSPASPLDGAPATTSYIASVVELSPVDYDVYTTQVNTDQSMNLTWTSPALSGWTVTQYEVEYNVDGGSWISATTTSSLTYTFNATSLLASSPVNVAFRVLATLTNGSLQTVITSNTESIYTFQYARAVQQPTVNWAIASTDLTTMDINLQFRNPSSTGVNDGLDYFTVAVYDASDVLIDTQDISYNALISPYTVNFDNITYSQTGYVSIMPYVVNPNGGGYVSSPNYEQDTGYIAGNVPRFTDVSGNADFVTGSIVTFDLLKPIGLVITPNTGSSGGLATPNVFRTVSPYVNGFEVSGPSTGPNNENIYTFTIDVATFFGTVPTGMVITAANNAGIGSGEAVILIP